jgi:predicted metalloprotease with PDZ domain
VSWLDLASHEYFHVWNVKRLRPVELGPFDYENEVHTKSLWIAEGVTEYYADLAVHRAGLMTRDEYLDSLSDRIEELQTTPGRLVQSAEMASFDAWIKYYRPDENSINTASSLHQDRWWGCSSTRVLRRRDVMKGRLREVLGDARLHRRRVSRRR